MLDPAMVNITNRCQRGVAERIHIVSEHMHGYGGDLLAIGRKLEELFQGPGKDGVTDGKSRELLMLARGCVCRCSQCMQKHMQQALDLGATRDEVAEAILIALYWAERLCEKPTCTEAEHARDRSTRVVPHPERHGQARPLADQLPPGYLIEATGCVV
jgi:AhpD family alkylhydroperoxidase